jgi:ribonuclease J
MGISPENIFVSEIGRVLEIDKKGARFNGSVPAGKILVDGSGIGDVGSVVLRDRKHLSQDGLIVVVATVDLQDMTVLSGPDIISRGFVYVRESEEMMEEARARAGRALEEALADGTTDWMQLKNAVREALSKYFFNKTKRKPMILPVIMNV